MGAARITIGNGHVGVIENPWTKLVIELLQELHVLPVVTLHGPPRRIVTGHAFLPKIHPLVAHLGPKAEGLSNKVQLARWEPETLHRFIEVNLVEGARREHPVEQELCLQDWNVEVGPVVVDQNIGFVQELVNASNHLAGVGRMNGIKDQFFGAKPLGRITERVPAFDEPINWNELVSQGPSVGNAWAGFDVYQKDFQFCPL